MLPPLRRPVLVMQPTTDEPHPSALHPDGEYFLLSFGGDFLSRSAIEPGLSERLILVQNFLEDLRERTGEN